MSLRKLWNLIWHLKPSSSLKQKYMREQEKLDAKKKVAKGDEVKEFFQQRGALRGR